MSKFRKVDNSHATVKLLRRKHFTSRLRARYGIKLDPHDYGKIHNNKRTDIARLSKSKTLAEVEIDNQLVWVVYSKSTKQYITALEPYMVINVLGVDKLKEVW